MNAIAAISTAQGVGGIGIVRISGEDSIAIADKVFRSHDKKSKLKNLPGYRAKFGEIIDNDEAIDEAIALVFRAPHSYTGENVVEISCHGGLYLTKKLLSLVIEAGAKLAKPGEFTKRAFLNGKMSLEQAESVMDLISCKNKFANKLAFSHKKGELNAKILVIKNKLISLSAQLNVWADYPDDNQFNESLNQIKSTLSSITIELETIIKDYKFGKIIKNGLRTVIVGKPNVGKSTIMNLLSGYERSIITDIPGTTRDIVEEEMMIGDIQITLVDTAGIRETNDLIEKIGIEKTKKYLNEADLVFLILDSSNVLTKGDYEILSNINKKNTICILNKKDITNRIEKSEVKKYVDKIVEFSAINGTGVTDLTKKVQEFVNFSAHNNYESVISNERQLGILKKLVNLLKKIDYEIESGMTLDAISVLIEEAVSTILEFTGEKIDENITNEIFSKFCVGK